VRVLRATIRLLRLDSSILAFLSILIPVFVRSNDLGESFKRAIPLLFISMCTFIINDLDDLEKDRTNHPDRPLPRGYVKPVFVVVLYYVCLALALWTTRIYIPDGYVAFWYYLLLTTAISYGYVVEYLPGLKPAYVAGASSIPVVILAAFYPQETELYLVAVALFAFMLGRELCMDVRDRPGDPASFLHAIHPKRMANLAFALQATGLLLLSFQITKLPNLLDLLLMTLLWGLALISWFRWGRLKLATGLMKAVVFLGLYFLL
jgi:geranylgeranylglycerol-phosphate geranylgeranyltransferase